MRSPATTSQVRPFTEDDIEQVAELHRSGFGVSEPVTASLIGKYNTYFSEVFLNNPWSGSEGGSLVFEEDDGRISGFMGSIMRPMTFKGERFRVRIGTQFIVDPKKRGFAGLKLLGAFFAGPQDLSIGDEANYSARQLWEAFNGCALPLYSMHWYYPLKPFEALRRAALKLGRVPPVAPRAAAPFARALDVIAGPMLRKLARNGNSGSLVGFEPTTEELARCMAQAQRRSLRPDYDGRSLEWLLDRARRLRPSSALHKMLFKTEDGEAAGWYVFAASRGAFADVLQLHANPGHEKHVLERLIEHARSAGAAALDGRMEPGMMQALSDKRCPVCCGPEWVLARSRRPELIHALMAGDALFSRLEGEWCLRFQISD